MKGNLEIQKDHAEAVFSSHPVKLTALLYLKEALMEERYEECSELIRFAREFGAKDFEIASLVEDARREVT